MSNFPHLGRVEKLLQDAVGLEREMSERAQSLEREECFPAFDLDLLRAIGAFSAVIPLRLGGLGLGIDPDRALPLFKLLRSIGRGNLALGRIFEGHVNAFKLISTFGSESQIERAASDVTAGHLFAIWNAETTDGVRIVGDKNQTLSGAKAFCSAAGQVTRALITAREQDGMQMLLIPLGIGERVESSIVGLQGMRATSTSTMKFDGINISSDQFIGTVDDYTREPTFSAGAWRTSAVILGGLDTLLSEMQRQLRSRNRHDNPHQLSRLGQALIARESARIWIERAARMEERTAVVAADITGYINLSRTAVESAALDIIRLVQRTLGLPAFLQTNPVERLMRDVATYLRQPAGDEALTEAAGWFLEHGFPEG